MAITDNNSFLTSSKVGISPRKSKSYPTTAPYASLEWEKDEAVCALEEDETAMALVVVGERPSEGPSILSIVQLFDPIKRAWSSLPGLSTARCGCSVASIEKKLYVFGGLSATNERLDTCESYDMDQQRWDTLPIMPSSHRYCASVAFPLHGDVVVLGGRDQAGQELASVDAYDTNTKEWHTLSAMSSPRFGCGAARIASSKMIVVGGFNGEA